MILGGGHNAVFYFLNVACLNGYRERPHTAVFGLCASPTGL
jgi:hypothetical protein